MTNVVNQFLDVYFTHKLFTIIAQARQLSYNILYGAVAHRSEQAAHNHLVDSSTLSSPTTTLYKRLLSGVFLFVRLSDEPDRIWQVQRDHLFVLYEYAQGQGSYLFHFGVGEDLRFH